MIAIQKQAGWDVGSAWYDKYVTEVTGKDASEQDMLRAFTDAFNKHFSITLDGTREAGRLVSASRGIST